MDPVPTFYAEFADSAEWMIREKMVKCSISSYVVPWMRRWIEKRGKNIWAEWVPKCHSVSGDYTLCTLWNFTDWQEMTAVCILQFKPNPTTKKEDSKADKMPKKNFLWLSTVSVLRRSARKQRYSFFLCATYTTLFHVYIAKTWKKMKLFSGEFREFPNCLITGLQSIQL